MAITRRQFVTRLGALAAAVGMSQGEFSKITEAFAGVAPSLGGTLGKPRVVWIHGAECTGCSTSFLGILEDTGGNIFGTALSVADALVTTAGVSLTLGAAGTRSALWGGGTYETGTEGFVNVADVLIDVVDVQYHETIMGPGGDLATQWLQDFRDHATGTFVLVVEGAVQEAASTGAWGAAGANTSPSTPWCSVGMADDGTLEQDFGELVTALAAKAAAIIAIGQCATFGGYPGCKPQLSDIAAKKGNGGFDPKLSQTGAKGVYDHLADNGHTADAGKVINVPGCPTNPWWFVLTVTLLIIDLQTGTSYATTRDSTHRPTLVYPIPVHSAYCPRYGFYNQGIYATKPGDPGCLQKLGCKGIATNSLCGAHGWNNQQPQNTGSLSSFNPAANGNTRGGHCTRAGHPCMACTEKGYPDSFVPFVKR